MTDRAPHVPASYPLRAPRIWNASEMLWGTAFTLPVLILYLWALPGAVGWWDSGELLACARTLSVAHRPGFPLYVLCGRVTFGFLDDPRWLANAASALAAALALACTWRGLCLLAGGGVFTRIWVAVGGWLVAASPLFLRQAIRIEVYAPAYAALGVAFLLAAAAQRAPDPRTAVRRFLASAYVIGLAFCLHSAVTAPLSIVVVTLYLWGDYRPSLKQWTWSGLCVLAGMSVYALIPLRTPMAPYVWGRPDSLAGLFAYITAADSHGIIVQEASGTLGRVGELTQVLVSCSPWPLVIVGLAGILHGVLVSRRCGRAPLVLAIAGLAVTATVVSFVVPDNADLQAYLVPLLLALWWGWARIEPAAVLPSRVSVSTRRTVRFASLVVLIPVLAQSGWAGYQAVGAARLELSDRWGTSLMAGTQRGDLVIVQDANTDFLLRGLAHSDAAWTGATVLNATLADAAWYRDWWQSRYGLCGTPGDPDPWPRQIARSWKSRGGRVLVDYGTPGWMPSELSFAGFFASWGPPGSLPPAATEAVPPLRVAGADQDPEWVRSVVWFYYRLGAYYRACGQADLALRAWDEGLAWAPEEELLRQARAEVVPAGPGLGIAAEARPGAALP
jgi:hypothetical protein